MDGIHLVGLLLCTSFGANPVLTREDAKRKEVRWSNIHCVGEGRKHQMKQSRHTSATSNGDRVKVHAWGTAFGDWIVILSLPLPHSKDLPRRPSDLDRNAMTSLHSSTILWTTITASTCPAAEWSKLRELCIKSQLSKVDRMIVSLMKAEYNEHRDELTDM